jgi:MFS family permease
MGFDMLLPTLSLYLVAMGCEESDIGLIFSTFAVSSILSRFYAPRLSQKFGHLATIRCGLILSALGVCLYFLIQKKICYGLARLLFGAGYGLSTTLLVTATVSAIPLSRIGEGLSYFGLGSTLALAVGPLVGLWLLNDLGYVALFSLTVCCYLMAVLISFRLPKRNIAPAKPDPSWAFFSALKTLFKPSLLALFYGMAVSAVTVYLAVYCAEKNLPDAARYFLVSTIGTLCSRMTSGRIYDRYGARFVIIPAASLVAIALLEIYFCQNPIIYYQAAVLYGLGAGSLFPGLQALALSSAPREKMTTASAFFYTFLDIGFSCGTLIMGFLADLWDTFGTSYLMGSAIMVLIVVTFINFFPRNREMEEIEEMEIESA